MLFRSLRLLRHFQQKQSHEKLFALFCIIVSHHKVNRLLFLEIEKFSGLVSIFKHAHFLVRKNTVLTCYKNRDNKLFYSFKKNKRRSILCFGADESFEIHGE